MLDKAELETYNKTGALIIELPGEIQKLQEEFLQEINEYLEFFHPMSYTSSDVSKKLVELSLVDRAAVGKLYKLVRRFPSVRRLSSNTWCVEIAKQLMETSLVSCCNFVATRFDLPNESKYATAPHQDFPYIQGSQDGITIWIPFVDVLFEVGAPSYVPNSHLGGARKIIEEELDGGNGTASIKAVELNEWQQLNYKKVEIKMNQALVMHTLLIHRSEPNISEKARISSQFRFDNIKNNDSWSRNYPEGLFLNEMLSMSYPELVGK
jgi:hypothetical protein